MAVRTVHCRLNADTEGDDKYFRRMLLPSSERGLQGNKLICEFVAQAT